MQFVGQIARDEGPQRDHIGDMVTFQAFSKQFIRLLTKTSTAWRLFCDRDVHYFKDKESANRDEMEDRLGSINAIYERLHAALADMQRLDQDMSSTNTVRH